MKQHTITLNEETYQTLKEALQAELDFRRRMLLDDARTYEKALSKQGGQDEREAYSKLTYAETVLDGEAVKLSKLVELWSVVEELPF